MSHGRSGGDVERDWMSDGSLVKELVFGIESRDGDVQNPQVTPCAMPAAGVDHHRRQRSQG